MEGSTLTNWLLGGGAVAVLGGIASTIGVFLKYRYDLKTATTAETKARGDYETEARKMTDAAMQKLADTLTARVDTVEKENATVRGYWHDCEEKHATTRVEVAGLKAAHQFCEQTSAELRAENDAMCRRIEKIETKVESVLVNK